MRTPIAALGFALLSLAPPTFAAQVDMLRQCRAELMGHIEETRPEIIEAEAELARALVDIIFARRELQESLDMVEAYQKSGIMPEPRPSIRDRIKHLGSPIPGRESPNNIQHRINALEYHFHDARSGYDLKVAALMHHDRKARSIMQRLIRPEVIFPKGKRFRMTLPGDYMNTAPLDLAVRLSPSGDAYKMLISVSGIEEAEEVARRLELWFVGMLRPVTLDRPGVEVAFPWMGTYLRAIDARDGREQGTLTLTLNPLAASGTAARHLLRLLLQMNLRSDHRP